MDGWINANRITGANTKDAGCVVKAQDPALGYI
jgi:hypothetical protein